MDVIKFMGADGRWHVIPSVGPQGPPGRDGTDGVENLRALTSAELSGLDAAARAALYAEGARALKVTNGDTVTLHGLRDDGSLDWLGSNRPVVNLLDNSDFARPVNQRGAAAYTPGYEYTIDRWIGYDCTVTIGEGGLALTQAAGAVEPKLYQIRNDIDQAKAYTFAADINGEIACLSGTPGVAARAGMLFMGVSNGMAFFEMGGFGSVLVRWAALYEGAYTVDTLPPYAPKGYAQELAECQRYYQTFASAAGNVWNALGTGCYANSGQSAAIVVPLVQELRARPSVAVEAPGYLYGGGSYYAVSGITVTMASSGSAALNCATDAAIPAEKYFQGCVLAGGARFALSADL